MAFDSTENTYKTPNENGCLMDSDLNSLKGNPTSTLSDSWIPKGSIAFTPTLPDGCEVISKDIHFSPVQVAADKSIYVDFTLNLSFTAQITSGASGTSSLSIAFSDFTGVTPLGIQVSCSRDSSGSGYPVIATIPYGKATMGSMVISLWNTSNTSKTYNTTVNLTIYGQVTNTDFGFGQLFPNVEIN